MGTECFHHFGMVTRPRPTGERQYNDDRLSPNGDATVTLALSHKRARGHDRACGNRVSSPTKCRKVGEGWGEGVSATYSCLTCERLVHRANQSRWDFAIALSRDCREQ